MDLNDVYLKMPHAIRKGAVGLVSLKNRRARYGSVYDETLALLRRSEFWSEETMARYQASQLARLLQEAREHTGYYREALSGFSSAELEELALGLDVSALPLLEKKTLKAHTDRFVNASRTPVVKSSTSGSTGSPLKVAFDRESMQRRFAFMHRQREWGGCGPFDRSLRLSGRRIVPTEQRHAPFWVEVGVENQMLLSTYHLREELLPVIARRVRQWRPRIIDGYPTAIRQLADHFARAGEPLPGVDMVVSTAETLDEDMRQGIEQGLGARVFDYYAASEGVPLIQQSEHGHYFIRSESGIFEFLDPQGDPVGPGEVGEIVVTSFCQWQYPLIRYRTGDMAMLPTTDELGPTPCGRTLPRVAGVVGRIEDLVVTRDGRQLGMFSYRTLKFVEGIREAQIIQKTPERFVVKVVLDGRAEARAVGQGITKVFADALGYVPEVELDVLEAIERGANGKFRSTVCECPLTR